jgi:hypothetical protein
MMHQAHPSYSPPRVAAWCNTQTGKGKRQAAVTVAPVHAPKFCESWSANFFTKADILFFVALGFVWDLLQRLSEQLSHIQKATDKLRPCAISLHLGRERAVQSLWVAEEKSFRERSKSARVQECKKLNGIEWVFVVWVFFCESELGSCVGAC